MDQGNGNFKKFFAEDIQAEEKKLHKEFPNHGGTFTIGEELEIKGSKFKVMKIMRNRMMLKLLPK